MATSVTASRYLEHLPAFFSEEPTLGRLLLAFERVLSGLDAPDPANFPSTPLGLEQLLDLIDTYFDPLGDPNDARRRPGETTPPKAPDDFLPWLATWVATSLRDDWDSDTRRAFIAGIVPLYRRRGTKRAMQRMLQLYLNPKNPDSAIVDVIEDPAFPPRYFQVAFTIADRDPKLLSRKAAIATAIVDQEKPAHTYYGLRISYPSLELTNEPTYDNAGKPVTGVFIGITTVLGSVAVKPKI
jgi:phage tail-like protein